MPGFAAPLQQGFPGPADTAREVALGKHLKEILWGRRVLNNLKAGETKKKMIK